ncbi:unnamed protein product [Linum tenue]|uniref:GDP-Man:Man(3)GlcNAc(2)-PP-Dol alpha-1,2-mannosyltransferase n=1 Tax=Linum tenue TaxID=586396 RepID=A0AAV0K2P4_9ROSI|nr:unnamed protein product [Linum tenue]CAI0416046.1 unnamed protein product [Linum tenue]
MASGILVAVSLFTSLLVAISTILASHILNSRRHRKRAVGFFHPYTNDGGGGERVLWCAVKAIQEEIPDLDCIVYTGDHDASPQSLAARATDRFGVQLLRPPKAVHLYKRKWVEESTYPRFTMIGQSLGSILLSWEALSSFTPLYYFDTSGYAFTYPIARLFGCKVICYTHYPTISLDMISRVRRRSSMYNNDASIARSGWLSRCKLVYYTFFSWLYGFVGSCAHLAMVNSSWTRSHIEKLWRIPDRIKRVYPPCDTSGLQFRTIALFRYYFLRCFHWKGKQKLLQYSSLLLSSAQRRWGYLSDICELKAHPLQLEAFALAITRLDAMLPRPKLQFVGSCRNKADEERLQKLKDQAVELKVDGDVEFHKNVMYRDLIQLLGGAVAGLHSMTDEHFGISVVEYMAAGAIPIAHNSAGPKMDIVLEEEGEQTGFLAETVEEYADAIIKVIEMPETERLKMAGAARRRAGQFSEQRFYEDLKAAVRPVL